MSGIWRPAAAGAGGKRLLHKGIDGIICPVSECEPQVKHELSGIDTMFLSEHERYAKCELRNMV